MPAEQRGTEGGDSKRHGRVQDVLADCQRRRAAGEAVSDEAVMAAHPELMPELGEELRKLRIIAGARERAAKPAIPEPPTRSHHDSDTDSGHLEVRCPNCHSPLEVAVDTQLTDLTCSACGSHFSLVDQGQATRIAPLLSKMGRFELIERLGVGGFGSVWKARDKELDRTVAVKIPRAGVMTAEEQEKFFREARAAAQLRHPSIVSVHEVGRDGDSVYIVSDFVRGVTLGDWLTAQQLTNREAAELCAKIADALHHAHEKGVVHRDLKPANIMIDGDGQPHLMDFGLARRDVGEVTVTMDGHVMGTPAYMSPEQAEGKGHHADRRSDVYSLGVILFQLLTGELPFRGNQAMLIHQAINDEPPSPRKLNSNVPKDLETITLKCMEKEPARRYQSALEVSDELRRLLAGEPIHSRPIGGPQRAWRWAKRRPTAAALLAVLAAVAVIGPVVAVRQTVLRVQRDRISAEREQALRQLDEKNEALQNQLADSQFERASAEYDAGHVPEAIAILAAAHETTTAENPLRAAYRSLLAGWSTEAARPFVHDEPVAAVAFSSDGRTIATGSHDRTVRMWDRQTGAPRFGPLRHSGPVQALAFSPDGSLLLTGSGDATVRFWDTTTGQETGKSLRHGGDVYAVAFSPDGKLAATAGGDRVARLWDVATRTPHGEPLRHDETITSLAFRPNGKQVATGSFDRTARLWDIASGQAIGEVMQNKEPIRSIAFSPDGRTILTGGQDGSPKIWNVESTTLTQELPRVGWIYSVAFSPDGNVAWVGNIVGQVSAFNLASSRKVFEIKQEGRILALAVSPDNSTVLSGSSDSIARLVPVHRAIPKQVVKQSGRIFRIALSPDGRRVLTAGDNLARLWSLDNGTLIRELNHGGVVQGVAFAPAGNHLLTSSWDGRVFKWDARTGEQLGDPLVSGFRPRVIVFNSAEEPLVVGTDLTAMKVLNGRTESVLATMLQERTGGAIASGANGRMLAKEVGEQRVMLWDLSTPNVPGRLLRVDTDLYDNSLAFSPDGTMLVVGGEDEDVSVWDVGSANLIRVLKKAGPRVLAVAFSPDGQSILTGTENRGARLWDARTGKPRSASKDFGDWVRSVAFSHDGQTIYAGCENGGIWRWDAPLPLPDDRSEITAWAKAHSAMVVDDQRTPRRLKQTEWLEARTAVFGDGPVGVTIHVQPDEQAPYLQPAASVLRAKIGKDETVEMEVARVDFRGNGVLFLRSLGDISRPDCFDVMLREPHLEALQPWGIRYADQFVGRRIRVSGKLVEFGSRIEIVIGDILRQLQIQTPEGDWVPEGVAAAPVEFVNPPVSELRRSIGMERSVVFRVAATGGLIPLYLNSRVDFRDPDCFTAVVEQDQTAAFSALGVTKPAGELPGKMVRVTGKIEESPPRSGQISIRITDVAKQLEIVDTGGEPAPKTSHASETSK